MTEQELHLCPDCQQKSMSFKSGELKVVNDYMECANCESQIPLDIYMMSLELLQKEILVELLKQFVVPGHGKIIEYQDRPYVVGISESGNYVCQEYELQEGEQIGIYVKFEGDIE